VQDLGGIAAEVEYEYDARDQLRKVIDPKGLTTEYVYDGLGNQITLISPDTGTTSYTYDAARQPDLADDARGVVTSYTYDATQSPADDRISARKHRSVSFDLRQRAVRRLHSGRAGVGPVGRIQYAMFPVRRGCASTVFGNLRRKMQTAGSGAYD
jgi:YD repeat-containing protein